MDEVKNGESTLMLIGTTLIPCFVSPDLDYQVVVDVRLQIRVADCRTTRWRVGRGDAIYLWPREIACLAAVDVKIKWSLLSVLVNLCLLFFSTFTSSLSPMLDLVSF